MRTIKTRVLAAVAGFALFIGGVAVAQKPRQNVSGELHPSGARQATIKSMWHCARVRTPHQLVVVAVAMVLLILEKMVDTEVATLGENATYSTMIAAT
jgi:hypothetical protein